MRGFLFSGIIVAALLCALFVWPAAAVEVPAPAADEPLASSRDSQTIVLAGGCFWGMQLVFEHVKGIAKVTSGYAGGSADTANYETVSTGSTGHAEAVQIEYDPSKITAGQILRVYFAVAHDPTELNRQGPDFGTQYRSEIFYTTPQQQEIAQAYIAQLQLKKVFSQPIVTRVTALKGFYAAEPYHQDYATRHPNSAYIVVNDLPKLNRLQRQLPQLYTEK